MRESSAFDSRLGAWCAWELRTMGERTALLFVCLLLSARGRCIALSLFLLVGLLLLAFLHTQHPCRLIINRISIASHSPRSARTSVPHSLLLLFPFYEATT